MTRQADREVRKALLSPLCRNYGHLFVRDYFLGFIPIGRPYCLRCGRRAAS